MRKIVLLVASAFALAGVTAGCGISASDESNLTIYTARDKGLAQNVVDAFEAANPDYKGKVRLLTLGAQEAAERVSAEKGRPQADIWWGGTQQQFVQSAGAGLLAPVPEAVKTSIPEKYRDAQGRWVAEMLLNEVIFYNDKMLKPDQAPKDWDDLVKPAYKNKIIVRDVAASGTMRSIYSAMISRKGKDGDPAAGYDWLRKLDANTKVYAANPTDLYLRMQRQEAPVSVWNLQDVLLQRKNSKAPFAVVSPASGVPQLLDGVAKIAKGPNSAGADAFLTFLLGQEQQKKLAEEWFQIPTVKMDAPPSWLAPLKLTEMKVDWDAAAAKENEWITHWGSAIKNKG
ncbi:MULTISPECIES: extracellular solute-binding protein [Thermomonosporaceae]|uniref:extracellular solute-binding protein n=1 Tax=Thermomonosporaceae TaxID=2012 RepID=UPI00255AA67C|nr:MULTISPECIES: extracellular solute-binding protein [Thermomonosporaceae]MDL4776852.1 extracellular solute-binding protein [Actinomadura xylanilytica]